MAEQPNYYAVIPANVRYSEVSANAKLLYGEISALTNTNGRAWAGNNYFASLYGVAPQTVSGWINELVKSGFILSVIDKSAGNKRFLELVNPIKKNLNSYSQKPDDINNTSNTEAKASEISLLKILNRITGRTFRTLPHGTTKLLKTFTLEEIEKALTAMAADPWHAGKLKELSSDYMLRATTIDKFLGIEHEEEHPQESTAV